jgi:DNA-directed RNA polymerase specialized sigma24 family protein
MASDDGGGLPDFVAARYAELRRSAFLMCGDWALADELTRKSLARLVTVSRRTTVDDPDAFAYSHLMAEFQRRRFRRRRARRQHLFVAATQPAPEAVAAGGTAGAGATDPIRTILVLDALHKLTTRCRAVLVLRHWDGFAVDETADMLGLADERVDAYEAAGLAALDYLLAVKLPARAGKEPAR